MIQFNWDRSEWLSRRIRLDSAGDAMNYDIVRCDHKKNNKKSFRRRVWFLFFFLLGLSVIWDKSKKGERSEWPPRLWLGYIFIWNFILSYTLEKRMDGWMNGRVNEWMKDSRMTDSWSRSLANAIFALCCSLWLWLRSKSELLENCNWILNKQSAGRHTTGANSVVVVDVSNPFHNKKYVQTEQTTNWTREREGKEEK